MRYIDEIGQCKEDGISVLMCTFCVGQDMMDELTLVTMSTSFKLIRIPELLFKSVWGRKVEIGTNVIPSSLDRKDSRFVTVQQR